MGPHFIGTIYSTAAVNVLVMDICFHFIIVLYALKYT